MAKSDKVAKRPDSEPVKDLEGLSDEELDQVSGGNKVCGSWCCKTCGGGCGCAGCVGTTHEANVKGELGDVELTPTKTDAGK